MLTRREAFTAGFLARCAELGLTQAETENFAKTAAYLVKQGFADKLLGALGSAGGFLQNAGALGLAGLAVVPPAAGAMGGYMAGRMTDVDDEDVDAIKQRELIDELLRQKARLEHRNRRYQAVRYG